MNLINLTRMESGLTITTDKHGREHVLAVCKGTFEIHPDGTCDLSEKQHPIVYADEFYGDPESSSIRYESDFAFRKPLTDIVVNGSAHSPHGRPIQVIDVSIEFGIQIRKSCRVFGDRIWENALIRGLVPSTPKPFLKMPLTYERAFGGVDRSHADSAKHVSETRNPVGVGIHARLSAGIAGTALPNLEDPGKQVSAPTDRPKPVGFGFIGRAWQPRASFVGTYDDAWLKERFPFLPLDFDERYHQGAPPDQTYPRLAGGERVRLMNMTPGGKLEFGLPQLKVPVRLVRRTGVEDAQSILDGVLVEPDEMRVLLTWRATFPLTGKPSEIREVWVGEPPPGRRRALEIGKEYRDWRKPAS